MLFPASVLIGAVAIGLFASHASFLHSTFWVILAAYFGGCVGSFLNVVAYRYPIMLKRRWRADCLEYLELPPEPQGERFNLAFPKSHCPSCARPVRSRELVPVVSYAFLGGKCAGCANPIGVRYPLVEMLCAVLTAGAISMFGMTWLAAAVSLFIWVSVAIALIDADTYLIPDELSQPLLWSGILLASIGIGPSLANAVAGAVVGYGFLWTLSTGYKLLRGKEGMGAGDFKYLAACGAFLGWKPLLLVLVFAGVSGTVVGIASAMRQKESAIGKAIPFGPHLVAGAILVLLAQAYLPKYFPFLLI